VKNYCKLVLNRSHRGALAKFRSGTALIGIELGHYNDLPVEQRLCSHCQSIVEDKKHVLLQCPLYDSIRNDLIREAQMLNNGFDTHADIDSRIYIL
jgi:Zn finger protein HypA/HybF involved in hydrogenase expression